MKFVNLLILVVWCSVVFLGCSNISRENFDKIKMGMGYEEVVAIIGEPDTCDGALGAKKCVWGNETKNITISFMGEKVILPVMKGLQSFGGNMQFIVIGRDGTDEKALDRRMAAREAHLETAKKMHESGNWLYAAAILNDEGKMAGSMIVCDFESREALDKEWLDNEAYVKGNVWETIEVQQAAVAPFWAPKQLVFRGLTQS